MKVDEILKYLENVEIDENEKREIAEYIARKLSVDDSIYIHRIMTKYKKIYDIDSYGELLESNNISPSDAYVFIDHHYSIGYDSTKYFYPFLNGTYLLSYAYLSKLELGVDFYRVVPASGLKYVSMVIRLSRGKRRIVVEVADIDNAAINTNLPTLIRSILSTKQIDDDVIGEVESQLSSQKLFAGYDFYDARDIINTYYALQESSLAKEVEAIRDAYNRIFQPCRVVYDLETKQFQVGDNDEDRRNT
jgi:hypothetical protein